MNLLLKIFVVFLCAGQMRSQPDIFEKVAAIEDSITVGQMTIHNAFKYQVLAHQGGEFNASMIVDKVYSRNKTAFGQCLSQIFGEENAGKFQPDGILLWNKNLLNDMDVIRQKLSVLDSVDINMLFNKHLKGLEEITGQKGVGKWLIYFGPRGFQIFGGCSNDAMILDMMGDAWSVKSIEELFAHELEHLVFNPILQNDPDGSNGLGITLDEGLAVYFTSVYLKQSMEEALYGDKTQILLDREKEIFNKLEPFFFKNNEDGCPIFRHCGRDYTCPPILKDLPEEVANELCYFIGYRIIEKYVEHHGKDSWKDIYSIPMKDFYEKSGYKNFIDSKF